MSSIFDGYLLPEVGGTNNFQFGLPNQQKYANNPSPDVMSSITGGAGGGDWQSMLKNLMGGNNEFGGIFGKTLEDGTKLGGWGMPAIAGIQGIANSYMGMKNYGLAKDALSTQKDQFNRQFNAQSQTLNTRMEDRQRARVASNPGAYQSVGSYMDQNRIK